MFGAGDIAGRVFVGLVFAFAAAGKSRPAMFRIFSASLTEFGIGSERIRHILALLVIALECCTAIGVLPAVSAVPAMALAAGLVISFSAASVLSLRRGRRPVCSCFGRDDAEIGRSGIIRNCVIATLAVAGAMCASQAGRLNVSAADAVLGIGLAALATLVVLAWNDLTSLLRVR